MSKKRKRRSRASMAKRKQRAKSASSLAIPIIVAAVVLVIIVGALLSIEARQPDTISPEMNTAQARATNPLPYPDVARITVEETIDKLGSGQAVLVDVRSKSSYDTLHAEGAVSIPENEIETRLDELPRDVDLVLY
jgi:flagellar basal body-associated protein FliL